MISKPKHHMASSGAGGVVSYLENEKAQEGQAEGYYSQGEGKGRWHGELARELGLTGEVDPRDLTRLLEGQFGDADLSGRVGGNGDRRMATDVTFSAPKSFSMMAVHDERLRALDGDLQKYIVGLIEKEVATARHGAGGAKVEATGNIAVAAYTHEDARPVGGIVDPDRHHHFLILNATRSQETGKLKSLNMDWGPLGGQRMKLVDFAAKAWLAERVQALGYEIRQTADGFEIEGISREQIEDMSGRNGQIAEALAEIGETRESSTTAQRQGANQSTREGKGLPGREELNAEWRERMAPMGIAEIVEQASQRGPIQSQDETAESVKFAADHLGERDTVFSRDRARLAALQEGMGKTTLEQIDAEISQNPAYIYDGMDMTTRTALEREVRVVETVKAGRGKAAPMMTAEQAETLIDRLNKRGDFPLTAGQREGLMLALTNRDQTSAIRGAAGVGKTKAIMVSYVEQARRQGYEVVGLAPTSAAETELQPATGTERSETRTLASLLASRPLERPDRSKRIFVLDEAGMVSDRDFDRLQSKLARDYPNARLMLVGDHRQIGAVEAGRPLERILEQGACSVADVRDVVRQKDETLLELAQSFADGRLADARAQIEAFTTELPQPAEGEKKPTRKQTESALAKAGADVYMAKSPAVRAETLMMSPTNAVRRSINERVRGELIQLGEVDTKTRAILTTENKDSMTRAARRSGFSYESGMSVTFKEGKERTLEVVRAEARDRVILRDSEGKETAWNPREQRADAVNRRDSLSVSPGDRLVLTDIQYINGERLRNGMVLDVQAVSDKEVIAHEAGRPEHTVRLPVEQTLSLDRGWAVTLHKAQGRSPHHAQLVAPMTKNLTAQLLYVAATRGVESLSVVTDSIQSLKKNLEKWRETQTAQSLSERREQARGLQAEKQREAKQNKGQAFKQAREQMREQAQNQAQQKQVQQRQAQQRGMSQS